VVDATNLERNLFLLSELIDTGLPIILAVNMMDAAERAGIKVYTELLSRHLDLTVLPIVARSKFGLTDLIGAISTALLNPKFSSQRLAWLPADHPLRATVESDPHLSLVTDPSTTTALATLRYAWIRSIVEKSTKAQGRSAGGIPEKLDRALTSKVWGLPIMFGLFALIFQAIFLWAQIPMDLIANLVDSVSAWLRELLPAGILTNLLTEGIVPGVGNVLVFVPQIAILFFFIGILEDCGYLSRAAFLLDNFMRRIGLQGRAFIPLLSSFACAVPGILSTRTIPSRSDRLATIMIAPLMSCSARLPVYAVLIAAFIPKRYIASFISVQGLTLLGMYILGVIGACVVAWILKKILSRREPSFFVMEMPPLRLPLARVVLRGTYDSVVSFLRNASTIILACSIVLWFLSSYPKPAVEFHGNPVKESYAGQIGVAIEPLIRPLGFNWEIGIGILASFPAREVFITGLSTVYELGEDDEDQSGLIQHLQRKRDDGSFTTLTAISLMVFYVFACQCMSTLAVCRRETGSWAWTFGMFCYMTGLAWLASFVTYQIGSRWL
jgi:ferrous iron transport protein B